MEWSPDERSPGRNYHFMVSAVAPRPIAWVTTRSTEGVVNLAPFSWFQAVCADPPTIIIAFSDRDGGPKDTLRNILDTGELTINAVTKDVAASMVATSADMDPETSEADAVGVPLVPAQVVAPPRVAASPFHLECRLVETHRYGRTSKTTVVVAEVVHIHADDAVLDDRGNIDNALVPLVARLGGIRYTVADDLFELRRPE